MQPAGKTDAGPARSSRPSSRKRWDTTDLSLVAVFAALIAALAILPGIPVGPLGVPITLQTLGVMLAGVVLGPARGTAAVLLYLVAGLIGLPVFSGFSGGFGVLAGPSAGYLVAFPLAALVAGLLAVAVLRRTQRFRTALLFLACLAASLLTVHPLGIAGLVVNAGLPLRDAILVDAAYLPGDVLKNLLAAVLAVSVHRAFPRLLAGRRGTA
ncbi:biotin transporter BioY [Arthrobacter agilis]|jgi:biotin transport system substrate-specific component|uniref:biotin transporter BioY n=1 Tax=Arthrobacter agilis TaxID=37921 RepID=UPI00278B4EDC|nr:biotin transporter BioY [Arthrobacter agilis]MDQ0734622.1 biotin transport system substrate-specific component [Arthrobacter agilis]